MLHFFLPQVGHNVYFSKNFLFVLRNIDFTFICCEDSGDIKTLVTRQIVTSVIYNYYNSFKNLWNEITSPRVNTHPGIELHDQ